MILTTHMNELQTATMDADDPNEVVKAQFEYKSIRNFAEYIQMIGE